MVFYAKVTQLFLFTVALSGALIAADTHLLSKAPDATMQQRATIQAIRSAIAQKDYTLLGTILKANLDTNVALSKLLHIAKETHSEPLKRAVVATEAFAANLSSTGVATADYLQIALFIEANLHDYVKKKQFFLPTTITGLALPMEYAPKNRQTYIVLDSIASKALDYGKDQSFFQAINYDRKKPQLVARGTYKESIQHLLKMLHLTKNAPNIVQLITHTTYKDSGETVHTLYENLYSPGSLRQALDANTQFSLQEQASLALQMLHGLHELHERKIIHRNLGSRNYLITIPAGEMGSRDIPLVITNLQEARFSHNAPHHNVQRNPLYAAPEAIFLNKLHADDYYKTDVFAMGDVLYRLYYGKLGAWQNTKFITDEKKSKKARFKKMKALLEENTNARRSALESKANAHTITPQEEFELLILKMLNIDPQKRGSSEELFHDMERIYAKISAPI